MNEIISSTVYFQMSGAVNSDRVLQLAHERAAQTGIQSLVVATTTGAVGLKAAEMFSGCQVVAVSHSTGFKGADQQELTPEYKTRIEQAGGKVLTTTHAFGGVNRAIRRKLNTYQVDEVIAHSLRIFCEGLKVAVEISMMAADAGLISVNKPVIALGGTGTGTDTAVILLPAHAQNFFDLKILEIICMPTPSHPLFGA